MQNQLPLFLPYDQDRALPIVRKYEKIFAELDLSDIIEFNHGVGPMEPVSTLLFVLLLFDRWRVLIPFQP